MKVNEVKTAVIALQEGYGNFNFSADITSTTESASFMSPSTDGNINNGVVTDEEGTTVARFNSSDAQNLTVNYLTADDDVRAEVQASVSTFCKSARAFVEKAEITVNATVEE